MTVTQPLSKAARSTRNVPLTTLLAGCLAVAVAQAVITVCSSLNGLLQPSFDATGSQLSWISDASMLPVAVLELTFGVLGDLFGRRRLLIGGAVVIVAGELVAATAGSVGVLITGQVIAGVGAAMLLPTSLVMVTVGTRSATERARIVALWAGCLGAGAFLSQLAGSITSDNGSWRGAYVVVAVGGLLAAAVGLLARDSRDPEGRSLDIPGQITVCVGLLALLYGVIQGSEDGWGSARVITAFVVAALFLVLFIVAESRAANPLLHLSLFRNRQFAVASVAVVLGMLSFVGTCYAVSIRISTVQHLSPMKLAFAFFLTTGLMVVLTPLTYWLMTRVQARWLLGAGFLLVAVGNFLAATLSINSTSMVSLILPLGLVGIGVAPAVTSITATAVNTVPPQLAGMASAVTTQLRCLGMTLGPAVIGAVSLSRAGSLFDSSLASSSLPAGAKAAAGQVAAAGGPIAVNSVPPTSPPGAAGPLALHALGSGYSLGFAVCGGAALVSCLIAAVVLRGGSRVPVEEPVAARAVPA